MLKITKQLRRFAIKNWSASETATDAELQKLFGRKLLNGGITLDRIESINSGKSVDGSGKKPAKKDSEKTVEKKLAGLTAEQVAKMVQDAVREAKFSGGTDSGDVDPAKAFAKETKIRVKEAAESYSDVRREAVYPEHRQIGTKTCKHPFAGMPVRMGDVAMSHPSDRDKAISLAFVRFTAAKNNHTGALPRWLRMTSHDRELLLYALHNEKWSGTISDEDNMSSYVARKKLNEFQIKTMLDDTTSGGIEITPSVFDDALILTPILYGELFPYVKLQTITKGRRVKGGAMVNPSFTSGVGEGTAITPFNTSSFVTAFDTPIYPAVAAIELGQDFEEDSPVDLGSQIIEQYGLKALEWLDRVVAVGNGTNEPQGIFNSPAATIVNSTFGAGGPLAVSDFEGLSFGIGKQYRSEAGAYLAYLSNDYTYRKGRAIKVGEGDQRRVFGLDQASYQLLGYPYKVQNDIPDGYAAFTNLKRYRMYRRLGMQIRVETGGRQLALSNSRLLVVRMRFGGQLEQGAAAALMKDAAVM